MTTPFDERYFNTADGLRLYLRDYTQGRPKKSVPALCLPGLTRNSRDFEPLAESLADRHRVISPDLRGRGRSEYDSNWHNYHPAQYVADMWLLLEVMEIPRVVVIGTSLGGWMAMSMAHERPHAVAAAVINDIGPEVNAQGVARVKAAAGTLDKVARFSEAVAQTRACYEIGFPDWPADRWEWYTQTTEIALKMRQRKPDLHITTVPNRGHAPLVDEPEAIDAISCFLAKIWIWNRAARRCSAVGSRLRAARERR